jgi:hypothetical protein
MIVCIGDVFFSFFDIFVSWNFRLFKDFFFFIETFSINYLQLEKINYFTFVS